MESVASLGLGKTMEKASFSWDSIHSAEELMEIGSK